MLIPRFTIRWLLVLTTVCAGLSLVVSYAVQQKPWAIAFSLGMALIPLAFLLYAITFLVAWLCSQMLQALGGRGRVAQGASPFATAGLPRQIVPPTEPE
jgi:hypothetical protein